MLVFEDDGGGYYIGVCLIGLVQVWWQGWENSYKKVWWWLGLNNSRGGWNLGDIKGGVVGLCFDQVVYCVQ